ncbi:MAG: hypothetical protein J7M19_02930 [Planctomycetes bacterium]|nr:hypothetical protein [Planctomycetota bacterium]
MRRSSKTGSLWADRLKAAAFAAWAALVLYGYFAQFADLFKAAIRRLGW